MGALSHNHCPSLVGVEAIKGFAATDTIARV